jgi:hypothetical protein
MDKTIELVVPAQQYQQLELAAGARQMPVSDLALIALVEWLDRWTRIERARQLIRDLGASDSPDQSSSPGDVARNHDEYLYRRQGNE